MSTRVLLVVVASVAALAALAGPFLRQSKELSGPMKEAAFLVGTWEGEGTMTAQDGRHEATVREVITPKAGGTVIALEGLGKDKATGAVVHDAFGVLFFDPTTKAYKMRSFLASGQGGEFPATIKDGVIVWTMNAGPREIRYTIKLDAQGRWHEVGEIKLEGDAWTKFFEMTLKKVG
jgi:hypothetical protein